MATAGMDPIALGRQQPRVVDNLALRVQTRFLEFLEKHIEEPESSGVRPSSNAGPRIPTYVRQIQTKGADKTTLEVDAQHVAVSDMDLFNTICQEYYRFEPFLRKAVQTLASNHQPDMVNGENKDREFFVSFYNMPQVNKIRELKTDVIGHLFCISGTVTRTSEVRPELILGNFTCLECQAEQVNVEQQFKFTEPVVCKNPGCTNTSKWHLNIEKSKFIDWQRVRVQENSTEIPAGSMPRSLDIILRNEIVESAKAGDKCVFTGTLMVVPDVAQLSRPGERAVKVSRRSRGPDQSGGEGVTGLKALGVRELTYRMVFLASSVQSADVHYNTINIREENEGVVEVNPEEVEEATKMKAKKNIFSRMARSLAPNVYGNEDIKKGILLMLFGGVPKVTKEGMKLRGDINTCIIGDPSTAKSQFLKYISQFLPRAVYTSGKASSAAGLTASVVRDSDTGEFCIEAGALMLADNGICCIDEFDKMDSRDQVAIHEAMEQQTISIAKAGIQATLNARTSILAAANPIGGRYDKAKTLRGNVDMTPAIMSRFDLFFVLVDECDEVTDYQVANHIVNSHQHPDGFIAPEFAMEELQRYIKVARSITPSFTPESAELLVNTYKELRQNDAVSGTKSAYRITVRQLESIVRLSEAMARANLDDVIRPKYVKEAENLLRKSVIHVEKEEVLLSDEEEEAEQEPVDPNAGSSPDPPTSPDDMPEMQDDASQASGARATPSPKKQAPAKPAKQPLSLTYEQYRRMATVLVQFLREDPDRAENGMLQVDLVNQYLEEGEEINVMEELERKKKMVTNVINRLVTKDNVLLVLNQADSPAPEQRLLVVHPNYVEE